MARRSFDAVRLGSTAVGGTRVQRALAFVGALALVLLYALRRGSYDVVPRHEHAVAVLWLLALGLLLGLLPRRRPPVLALLPLGAFAALVLLTAIALSSTSSDERTGLELARVVHHAALYALPLCVLSRRTWTAAAAGLAAGVLAVTLLAVVTRLAPGFIASDPITSAFRTNRLSYPLGYWNAMGAWSATGVALGLAWSAHARTRAMRAVALAAVPVAILAVYLTYSRAGIGSVVLGVLVVAAVSRRRVVLLVHVIVATVGGVAVILVTRGQPAIADATGSAGRGTVLIALLAAALLAAGCGALTRGLSPPRLARRQMQATGSVLALVALVAAVAVGPRLIGDAYDSYRHPLKPAASADPAARLTNLSGNRHDVWSAALDAYHSAPLSGIGPGTFEFWWNRHGTNAEFLRDVHNIYLENLAELGWPGLLVILALLVSLAVAALRPRSPRNSPREAGALAGVAATLVVFAFSASVDWMWESTANATLAIGSAGVAAMSLSGGRFSVRLPARAGLTAVAVVALLVELPGLAGVGAVRESQEAVRIGDLPTALRRAQEAIRAEPWGGTPYLQRALVLERSGELALAETDAKRAVDHEPQAYASRLVLARIQLERGENRRGLREFEKARRLRPHSPLFAAFASAPSPSSRPLRARR